MEIVLTSFCELNRSWHDKDEVRLVFYYYFYIKPMPDTPKMFAIYYGSVLLAFESNAEIILKGKIEDILRNLIVLNQGNAIFQLKNNRTNFQLRHYMI